MIRNYPVHPVVTITIAAAVTVRDLRGRAVVLVLPDPEAVPVPLVQWDLRAPRVNPDFKATQVLSDLLDLLGLWGRWARSGPSDRDSSRGSSRGSSSHPASILLRLYLHSCNTSG